MADCPSDLEYSYLERTPKGTSGAWGAPRQRQGGGSRKRKLSSSTPDIDSDCDTIVVLLFAAHST